MGEIEEMMCVVWVGVTKGECLINNTGCLVGVWLTKDIVIQFSGYDVERYTLYIEVW